MPKKTRSAVQPAAPTPAPAAPVQAPPPQPPAGSASLITTTANGSNHGTKVDLQAVYQAIVYGLQTFYQPTDQFQMTTGVYTRDELVEEFQQFVGAAQATKASNQQWRADVQTERGLELHVRELRKGVQGIATARFGAAGAPMLQFGFELVKPRQKSAESKAVAVAKGLATRTERGTLGKVQKKDIKGNVSVELVVTPGPTPAQPAAPRYGAAGGASRRRPRPLRRRSAPAAAPPGATIVPNGGVVAHSTVVSGSPRRRGGEVRGSWLGPRPPPRCLVRRSSVSCDLLASRAGASCGD